ncbi:DMT family transporter [Sulfitobacter geojensis]|jgi:drug/metabolite transporter (DMT)-like permease|uniref:DMT family transporter n=2 Tax=Sulfitobacter geojensis TaxID=1342299 RepID=A0AAE2VZ59_9RHOB|nr:DMT family transporter [Sulfitobacter geojensis]MBM1690149.1 DMT family transporter [Sulfitobacter geojensis]MBM1694215.1 DMT family transporter [Sulfitobacter geojensis]MBM1706381.1 DMT family transporter [Sulfitobacter geojensis]MBM1710439.1 DMT family transporter [Sulfitobacter geojensis]MBM1714505.1 DMT family transporter [Sulfitobacter geojensis]
MAAASVLGGMAALGLTDNFVPFISERGSLWQFHFIRSLMGFVILGAVVALGYGSFRMNRPWAVLARSFFPASAMLIYFGCLSVLPIGVVVAGLFTAPLFVVLISILFQGKPVGVFRWAAVIAGFAGAVMVIQPDPAALDPVAFLPIVAGLFYAVGAVATRAWCEGESTLSLTAGFFGLLGVFGLIGIFVVNADAPAGHAGFVLRSWGPLDGAMLFWFAVQAVGSLIGIALIFRGYQLGEASHVAVFEYSLLVFASFWAWVLWDQTVSPLGLWGMVLIAIAGTVIALRSTAAERAA